jgi:hypothetical protein
MKMAGQTDAVTGVGRGMNGTAKVTRAIRVNVIGGTLILAAAGLTAALVVAGILPMDTQVVVSLVFGCVIGGLAFLTARELRQDRDDPTGAERRFQSRAVAWSAGLLAVGLVAVVGVIAWGLLR